MLYSGLIQLRTLFKDFFTLIRLIKVDPSLRYPRYVWFQNALRLNNLRLRNQSGNKISAETYTFIRLNVFTLFIETA